MFYVTCSAEGSTGEDIGVQCMSLNRAAPGTQKFWSDSCRVVCMDCGKVGWIQFSGKFSSLLHFVHFPLRLTSFYFLLIKLSHLKMILTLVQLKTEPGLISFQWSSFIFIYSFLSLPFVFLNVTVTSGTHLFSTIAVVVLHARKEQSPWVFLLHMRCHTVWTWSC